VLIVHYAVKTDPGVEAATSVKLERKVLDPVEPIPPGAIWIDMVEPTVDEDQKVERYLGAKVPSRSDPDFAQPDLHACVVSEAEGTPDVADVTFILGPKALVYATIPVKHLSSSVRDWAKFRRKRCTPTR
jgi:hypothetical protein